MAYVNSVSPILGLYWLSVKTKEYQALFSPVFSLLQILHLSLTISIYLSHLAIHALDTLETTSAGPWYRGKLTSMSTHETTPDSPVETP